MWLEAKDRRVSPSHWLRSGLVFMTNPYNRQLMLVRITDFLVAYFPLFITGSQPQERRVRVGQTESEEDSQRGGEGTVLST